MTAVRTSKVFLGRQPAAVDSAFAILETVARLGPGVTTRTLIETLQMPRATTYRLVRHLVEQGYLVRGPGLMLGPRVHALLQAAHSKGESTAPDVHLTS